MSIKRGLTVLIYNTISGKLLFTPTVFDTFILFLIVNFSTLAYSSVNQKDQPGLVFISPFMSVDSGFSAGLRAKGWNPLNLFQIPDSHLALCMLKFILLTPIFLIKT